MKLDPFYAISVRKLWLIQKTFVSWILINISHIRRIDGFPIFRPKRSGPDFICVLIRALRWAFLRGSKLWNSTFQFFVPGVPLRYRKNLFCLLFSSVISISIELIALITNIIFLLRFGRGIRKSSRTFPIGF